MSTTIVNDNKEPEKSKITKNVFSEEEKKYFDYINDPENPKPFPSCLILDRIYFKYKKCVNSKGCNVLINIKDYWNNKDPHIGFAAIYDEDSNNMYMIDFDLKDRTLISLYTKQKETSPELVKSIKLWYIKGKENELHSDLNVYDIYMMNEFELYLLNEFITHSELSWVDFIPQDNLKGVHNPNNDSYLKITNN